jgi:hypothetical protein
LLQKALGDAAYARMTGLPPGLHTRADLIDEGDLDEYARIVKGLRAFSSDNVSSGTSLTLN